jgi:hypothetical protein
MQAAKFGMLAGGYQVLPNRKLRRYRVAYPLFDGPKAHAGYS